MVRPLRKSKLDGTLYSRREIVEAEIQSWQPLAERNLNTQNVNSLTYRSLLCFIEALVHLVRNLEEGIEES